MQKTPSVFLRDFTLPGNPLTRQVNPEAQWVIDGEGVATRKYDGTCVMLDDQGRWWARREVKPGKPTPANFRRVDGDDTTGKVMGWEPIEQSGWAKFHAEVLASGVTYGGGLPGTYELVGPRINGNPERLPEHRLIRHADAEQILWPRSDRTYDRIRGLVLDLHAGHGWEGIVFHHPDGRMAKIKASDFRNETTP